MKKCGFIKEGVLRKEFFRFGQFYDICIFGLLRKEWIKRSLGKYGCLLGLRFFTCTLKQR